MMTLYQIYCHCIVNALGFFILAYCVWITHVFASRWEDSIKRAMLMGPQDSVSPDIPISPIEDEVLGLSAMTMHLNPRGEAGEPQCLL